MVIYCPPDFQTDPAAVKRIAVVSGGKVFAFEHCHPRHETPAVIDVGAVTPFPAMAVFGLGIAAIWLMPDMRESWPQLADELLHLDGYRSHELSSDGQLAGVVIQRPTGGLPMGIYAPFVNDAWGIAIQMENPFIGISDVAEGLALAAHTLSIQLRFSPSYTGLTMLRQELSDWERRRGPLPELSAEWRERLQELRPTYAVWRRPFPRHVLRENWSQVRLVQFDRNSSFVSSAREVGVGDPVPTIAFIPGAPGVYRVRSWTAPPRYTALPGPFCVGEGIGDYPASSQTPVWAWEPQIRLAIAHGYQPDVAEGYFWPKGQRGQVHDLFRSWQGRLWAARNAARAYGGPAGRIAEAVIKKAGVSTIGRLVQREGRAVVATRAARERGLRILSRETDASGELTGKAEVVMDLGRTDLVQPGWWSTIIANANERLWNALYRAAPHDTIMAYVDALFCLSALHPELCGDPHKPGAFRDAGAIRVPLDQLDYLDTLSAPDLVKALHHIGEENWHGEAV